MAEPDRPTRVLFVDAGVGLAGGQYSLIENLRLLDAGRVMPLVSSPPGSGLESFCRRSGIEHRSLPFATQQIGPDGRPHGSSANALLDAVRGVFHITGIGHSEHIDIVHANTFKAAVVASLASILTRRPMVFHSRTVYSHPPIGGLVARVASRIVAISRTTAEPYTKSFDAKIRIIPSGVDTERFRSAGKLPEAPLVGYLARISREKGLIHLVRCAPRLIQQIPDVRFLVGGRPFTEEGAQYLREVEAEIGRLGLRERFEWAGFVEDVQAFLERVAVVAVPSEEEGLGRTMLEAMSMERPVVATDCGGPAEVITNGVDGVLVAPGDEFALGNALASVLDDRPRATAIGNAARARVMGHYSSRASTEALMGVYDEITGVRGG